MPNELPGKGRYLQLIDEMAAGLIEYFDDCGKRQRLGIKDEFDVIPRLIQAIENPNFITFLKQAIENQLTIKELQ